MKATQEIGCQLIADVVSPGSSPWRHANFKCGKVLPRGCGNFSPAAFPQGHTVSFIAVTCVDTERTSLLEDSSPNNFTVATDSSCTGVGEGNYPG